MTISRSDVIGTKTVVRRLAEDLAVHTVQGDQTSHLVVRRGRSVLIDCHSADMRIWLKAHELPAPDLILHTHVQPAHCREADQFPDARILVHKNLVELASDRAGYDRDSKTTWENPADWPVTMGQERYGVAGSVTEFPPDAPLNLSGNFIEGDRIAWQDVTFEVIALPGHARSHVGFAIELNGEGLAIFTGDLLTSDAKVVNFYDLEINYGGTALPQLPAVLRSLAKRSETTYFPSTGPAIEDGPTQALKLADGIDAYHEALHWQSGLFTPITQPDYPSFGRYRQIHRGVYQINNFGNCIVLIDDSGRGLMIDPGPCDFESPARIQDFHRDLDLLQRDCGLRTIDLALITHFHGDHYDLLPELQKRYPNCRVAAHELVARVIESPDDFPYAARLPWYNVGFDRVTVDRVLREKEPFDWHGIAIETIHLPGHCYCHGGHLLTFNGKRLAITGDAIQTRGESSTIDFTISNHSIPGEDAGNLKSHRQLLGREIDLNLGGHGSNFTNCREVYLESCRRIEHALPYLQKLVPNDDLTAAFFRPGFPKW